MRRFAPLALIVTACAPVSAPPVASPSPEVDEPAVGVLVMAHGGSDAWNRTVVEAVAPLDDEVPTVIAFGMADPTTLRSGLDSLRSMGVDRVAVVRMFVSGESFLEQTEYFLGMRDGRPENLLLMGRDPSTAHPIEHGLILATHRDGLMGSEHARRILVHRALEASVDPREESVLLIAHGMGDEAKNDRVLTAMDVVATALGGLGFAAARSATLREDWASKRAPAEAQIRAFVSGETARSRRVIVVPMRLSGFGPYAEVLNGLEYVPVEGLLPHPEITAWLREEARGIVCGEGWRTPGLQCPGVATDSVRPR